MNHTNLQKEEFNHANDHRLFQLTTEYLCVGGLFDPGLKLRMSENARRMSDPRDPTRLLLKPPSVSGFTKHMELVFKLDSKTSVEVTLNNWGKCVECMGGMSVTQDLEKYLKKIN